MRSQPDLFPAEPTLEAFLTALAVPGHVAAAPHNQAMKALVCLDQRALKHPLEDRMHAIRAAKKVNVPAVMTRDAVAAILALLTGPPQLAATRLYGSGRRILEAVRRRANDIDDQMKPLTVRSGTGDKDRFTPFPATLTPLRQRHLARVKTLPQQDLAQGHGAVSPPQALARPYPHTAKAWGWPYVFPARNVAVDPRAGVTRRQHVAPSVMNKALTAAVRRAGLTKPISAHTVRHAFATHLRQRGTDIRTIQHLLGHKDLATTRIYPHVLPQGGQGVPSPLDALGV